MKQEQNRFLALWMVCEPEFWGELRDIQKKLLVQRLVKGYSFGKIALHHGVSKRQLLRIFEAMFRKIERTMGFGLGQIIRQASRNVVERQGDSIASIPEYQLN